MESSPILEVAELAKKRKFWRVSLYLSIAALVVGPVIGIGITLMGMQRSFSALGASGAGDTSQLSQGVGVALTSTAAGFFVAIIALICLVISSIRLSGLKKRPMEASVVQAPSA